MINIKQVTLQNFFSVGAVTQSIQLNSDNLTLVLGSNLDIGNDAENAKNAVGKSTLLNAISYAIYGSSLSNVKKTNLINKTNKKNMVVTLTFEKNSVEYRIERGRLPTYLKFFVNNAEQEITDESQGDSRKTQEDIENIFGMNHDLFKMIIGLNTYTEPFLSMRAADQRAIIEHLLGITKLSEKADALRIQIKETKDLIQLESAKIATQEASNNKINETINNLKLKQSAFLQKHEQEIKHLETELTKLIHVDIDIELKNHEVLNKIKHDSDQIEILEKEKRNILSVINKNKTAHSSLLVEINQLENSVCYACGQHLHDDKQKEILDSKKEEISKLETLIENDISVFNEVESSIDEFPDHENAPTVFYNNIKDAYDHRSNVEKLQNRYEYVLAESDPYIDQISELENTALQPIDWSNINTLDSYKEHQEFLLKLLTNKDSFVRKKIIDKNLVYLNSRLTYYLHDLGLPHQVIFQNDLTVNISILGQDLDFDNLSRGERTRLILGLSFAFRDMWENLQHSINLLFIDELLDSGLDGLGIEDALAVLKRIGRDRGKNIFLISHREELTGRVNNILNVIKENGFTHFECG